MTATSKFGLPILAPVIWPEVAPYWKGTGEGRLVLPKCNVCGTIIWYPRAFCTICHSTDIAWIEGSGRGEVYTFTVVRHSRSLYGKVDPYVLAYVELEEGPRVLTNVVGCDPNTVRIGQAVQAVFDDVSDGVALLRFQPVTD